ncbi:MAG TPA: NAD-binding protein [Polyangia bacterium]|jgi:Trk K+ transport system NAD-binding subunit
MPTAAASPPTAPPSGHVIVCGLGRVGYRLVTLLCRLGERVVVVSESAREDWLRLARDAGATVITGDARSAAVLEAAGIRTAAAVIAATNHDAVNIETALDARQLRDDLPVVIRLFDRDLAAMLEERLGVRRALGSSALAGPSLAFAALGEEVLASFTLGARPFVVGRVRVTASSPLCGRAAADVEREQEVVAVGAGAGVLRPGDVLTVIGEQERYARLCGVLPAGDPAAAPAATTARSAPRMIREAWQNAPAGLRVMFLSLCGLIALSVLVFRFGQKLSFSDALYFIITTVTTTGYGDITPKDAGLGLKLYACLVMILGSVTMAILYSFATDFVVSERFRKVLGQPPIPERDHTVVVGVGNLGYRVIDQLVASGRQVVAVDLRVEGALAATLKARCPVITGDGRMAATLESAGAASAAAIVAATGDDAVNLAVGLTCRRLAPGARVIVRLFDADFAHKLQAGHLVDVALSTSRIAAPTFVAAALCEGVVGAWEDDAVLQVLADVAVPPAWVGLTAAEVLARHGARVLLARADAAARPIPATAAPLREGSRILVATTRPLR